MKPWFLKVMVPAALASVVALGYCLPGEPRWKGRPLSAWLEAWDTNLRFPDYTPLRSGLTDEEIEEALKEIGPQALPFLLKWLKANPGDLGDQLNFLLDRQSWIQFRFVSATCKQSWAESGFQALGADAQPLLPELIRLTHSPDPDMRMFAYEAAFFTRPEKDILLALAYGASRETNGHVQAMGGQWLVERFPDEAERASP